MNPTNTLKPWLLLCGRQAGIGAVEAFETAAPDMSGKEEEIYFVYRVGQGRPSVPRGATHPRRGDAVDSGYDVNVSASQQWTFEVEVELHNSQNGLSELAGVAIAAERDQDLLNLFKSKGVAFVAGSGRVDNESTRDGRRHFYKHTLRCQFNTTEGFTHRKINHKVDTIVTDDAITLADD